VEQVRETIKTAVIFQDGIAKPYLFNWNSRTYKIAKIHSFYTAKNGGEKSYFWTVSSQDNVYSLEWNNHTLEWHLIGIDEERRA